MDGVLEILARRRECGGGFTLAQHGHARQLTQLHQQGQGLLRPQRLAQKVIQIAERQRREVEPQLTPFGQGKYPMGVFRKGLTVHEVIQHHIGIKENLRFSHACVTVLPSMPPVRQNPAEAGLTRANHRSRVFSPLGCLAS